MPHVSPTLTIVATAYAYVTTDLDNWNLTESLSTWGGGTQFHICDRHRRLGRVPLA